MRPAAMVLVAMLMVSVRAEARPCATMGHEALRRAGDTQGWALAERPYVTELFVDSATHPFRVHHETPAGEAFAVTVLRALEVAFERQVVGMGFPPPLTDNGRGGTDDYDVYVTTLGNVGALTIADDDDDPLDGRAAATSHIRIDPDVVDVDAFVHHEFQHALQFAIDARETLMFFESGAVLQELLAFPQSDGYKSSIAAHQENTALSIFGDGVAYEALTGIPSLAEYGAALFLLYLEETYGAGDGTMVRQLWEASVQDDAVVGNEPDWLDALDAATSVPLGEMLLDYSLWRSFVGPRSRNGNGPSIADELNGQHLVRTLQVAPALFDGRPLPNTDGSTGPLRSGCFRFALTAPAGEPTELRMDVRSLADPVRELGISILREYPSGEITTSIAVAAATESSETYDLEPGEKLAATVCDVGAADADDELFFSPMEVRLFDGREPPDAGFASSDASDGRGQDAGDEEPPAWICSCQASPADPFAEAKKILFPVMMVLTFITLFIRGRRVRRRRKSYRDPE